MEERRKNVVLALGLCMYLHLTVQHVVNVQSLILQGKWEMFLPFITFCVKIWNIHTILFSIFVVIQIFKSKFDSNVMKFLFVRFNESIDS